MLTENSILLTAIRNPFEPYNSRVTLTLEYKAQPVYMYLKDVLPRPVEEFEIIASVNGKIVDNDFIPFPNSSIVFTQIPAGGGGGMDALRTVASIAVMIAAVYFPPAWGLTTTLASGATVLSGWGIAASLGIAIGGSLLINALLPIKIPDEEQISNSYSWGANNIINEGAAFPVVYGTTKMVPPLIGIYSKNIWVGGSFTPDLQKLNALFAIGDHSVSSIGTVQINGSPSTAYDDVEIMTAIGGLSQGVIANFMDTHTQQGYDILINKTDEWYGPYDVPGTDITAIGVGIGFPKGLGYFNNDGNIEWARINVQAQYRIKDVGGGTPGSWVDWLIGESPQFAGAEGTAMRYHMQTDHSNSTGYTGTNLSPDEYQVRFKSHTGFHPPNERQYSLDTYIDYIEGIVKDDFRYPGASLLAVEAIATDQLSGGLPTITCVVTRGNITVYEQDGTPHSVSSSNPAWICYDILNNPEYGCNVSYERINYTEFNAWATFCSTNSYECNIVFDTNMSVPDALAQVSLLGRGHVIQRGTNFGVVIDKADTPVQMFTMGNIIEDTLNISYLSKKDRVNAIETTYYDATEDYDAKSFELRTSDFDTDSNMEENRMTLDLRGCTSKTQALELTKFLMNCNETFVQTAEFEVQVDALASNVGDVIIVSHDLPDWGASGDVVSATSNTIVIDHEIETQSSSNYKCIVRHSADDSFEEVAINNPLGVTTDTFTLTGTWSTVPSAHDLYIIGIENESYRDFRITRISRTHEMRRKITALEYNAGVYSDSANIADYEEEPHLPEVYSNSVNAYELYRKESGIMKTIVVVTWRGYGGLFYVYVKEDTADRWRLLGTRSYNMSYEFKDSEPGKTYIFAVSTTPNPGDGETVTITVSGYTYNPPRVIWPVTGLEIFGQGNNTVWQNKNLKLRWNMISSTFPATAGSETTGAGAFPPVTEFGGFRVKISNYEDGSLRREFTQIENTYEYSYEKNSEDGDVPWPNLTIQVWARDKYGQESEKAASIHVTNPAPLAPGGISATSLMRAVKFTWNKNTEIDFDHYEFRTRIVPDGGGGGSEWSSWISTPAPNHYAVMSSSDIDSYGTDAYIYIQVIAVDTFGTSSSTTSSNLQVSTLYVQPADIQNELFNNLQITDSDSNTPATLAKLYDGTVDSDGVSYTVSGTDKYVEYNFPIQTLVDRVAIWVSAADAYGYVAYTEDESTWTYLKAEGDHTLDSDGKLLAASNQSDAQTNYWTMAYGKNVAIFPDGVVAKACRFYFTGSWTKTVYELVFVRQVIAEQVVADQLSAITGAMGSLISGTIQSTNLAVDDGTIFDFDAQFLKMGGTNVFPGGSQAGIFIGLDTDYKMLVGDGSNKYFYFDGTDILLSNVGIQSSDWAASAGVRFDLTNKYLKMGGSNVTASGAAAGIFLGLDTSYKLYVGDGSDDYMQFDGTNVNISLGSGGAMVLKVGSDITFEATSGNTSDLTFECDSTTYTFKGSYDNEMLCIVTGSDTSGKIKIGYDIDDSTYKRPSSFYVYTSSVFHLNSTYDADEYTFIQSICSSSQQSLSLFTRRGSYYSAIDIETDNTPSSTITLRTDEVSPYTDSNTILGNATYCYLNIYGDAGVTSCSDKKWKKNVKPTSLGLDFIDKLDFIEWEFDSSKGKHRKRKFHGLLAQDVLSVLEELGYTFEDFAGVSVEPTSDGTGENWGLVYEQLIGPMGKAIQELHEKVKLLESS